MELHCIVRGTLEPPKYIVWYRGEQQVVPENEASGHENGWYTQIDRNIFGSTEHSRNTVRKINERYIYRIVLNFKPHSDWHLGYSGSAKDTLRELYVRAAEQSCGFITAARAKR